MKSKKSKTEQALQKAIDNLIDNEVPSFRSKNVKYDYALYVVSRNKERFRSKGFIRKGRWCYYVYKNKTVFIKYV